jgi:hypothetical protein
MAGIHKNVRRSIDDFIELDESEKELIKKTKRKMSTQKWKQLKGITLIPFHP